MLGVPAVSVGCLGIGGIGACDVEARGVISECGVGAGDDECSFVALGVGSGCDAVVCGECVSCVVFDGFDLVVEGGALGQECLSLEHEFGDGHVLASFLSIWLW